jgi:hypothetical protein
MKGAKTFSTTTFSIETLNMMVLFATLSIMTLNIKTLSTRTFSIEILNMMVLFSTLRMNDTQYNATQQNTLKA